MTMSLIEHIEVGSGGAASITFMNVGDIPSDYTDLYLLSSFKTNFVSSDVNDSALLTINGSTANQSQRTLFGDGSSATSFTATRIRAGDGGSNAVTANTFGNASCYIPNYSSSSAKSFSIDSVFENNATSASQFLHAGLWTGTDPITSLTLTPRQGTLFVEHSSFSLYGILAGSDGTTTVS